MLIGRDLFSVKSIQEIVVHNTQNSALGPVGWPTLFELSGQSDSTPVFLCDALQPNRPLEECGDDARYRVANAAGLSSKSEVETMVTGW